MLLSARGANPFNSLDKLTVPVAGPHTGPEPGAWALAARALGGLALGPADNAGNCMSGAL
jgi:hypothetical protein